MSSARVTSASSSYPLSSLWIRCSAALDPVHSTEWMFASTRNPGLSRSSPVALFVTVTSQMSRPSYDCPIDSTLQSVGASEAHAWSASVSSSYS